MDNSSILLPSDRRKTIGRAEAREEAAFTGRLNERELEILAQSWRDAAHDGQAEPGGNWSTWLLMAGRGFGKTRAGAEWVTANIQRDPAARVALIAASLGEARSIMVEGDSGLLAVPSPDWRPIFEPSRRMLRWPNGARATLFSAAEPDSLRGPQHSLAWCDELAKWDQSGGRAENCWDNLQLGMRLNGPGGSHPRIMVTTTPRAVPLVQRLVSEDGVTVTGGKTEDNAANLSAAFVKAVRAQFAGSALGRQELDGELLQDVEGALWSRALLERTRITDIPPAIGRIVIGVDPPASATGDACGIIVCALAASADRDAPAHGLVLADCSVAKPSPERWARAVADAAELWGADRVVAEANQGGAMVASVLRAASVNLPVKLVHASRGKAARAEPVAALYESGRVAHTAPFGALEDEMCGLMVGGEYLGPGRSPDRADALVYALTELLLGPHTAPRVRRL